MSAAGPSPVYEGDFPDPCLLPGQDRYYAYATNTRGVNVQLMVSTDLASWAYLGDALPALPAWAGPGYTWAPAVAPVADRFVLYYTVRHAASGRQCISVATASTPEGPFVDSSEGPLVLQLDHGGSIDPCPFMGPDGSRYLIWKSDDNAIAGNTSLWGQPLEPSALTLMGAPAILLSRDQAWEEPLIEAPCAVAADGTYYLFYSANWWESDRYGIGYATGPAPLGPYTKATLAGPWTGSGPTVAGPGGQDLCATPGGLVMAYHGWQPGRVGYSAGGVRSLYIARVAFVDGSPVVTS
jgi:beta-xylosidase